MPGSRWVPDSIPGRGGGRQGEDQAKAADCTRQLAACHCRPSVWLALARRTTPGTSQRTPLRQAGLFRLRDEITPALDILQNARPLDR